MAALLCSLLILAVVGASDGAWCVCRSDVSDTQLQKTLDYACGAGADCATIQQGGACFNPNTVRAHCSFAANSYFQRKGQSQQACDFSGTATLTNQDPSSGSGCAYPASSSAAGSSGSSTNTPATGTGSSTNTPATGTGSSTGSSGTTTVPGSTTPSTMTPTTGTGSNGLGGGGVLGGLGPSGNTISTDANHAGPSEMGLMGPLLVLMLSIFMV